MCSKREKVLNDFSLENKTEDDPEESNFELYLLKKSKLKNKKPDCRKHLADRQAAKEEDDIAQDSVPKSKMEERASKLPPNEQTQPSLQKEASTTSSAPHNFIDVPDYGFVGMDGSYQAPF